MERMGDILARTTRATRGRLDGSRTSAARRGAARPVSAPPTRPLSKPPVAPTQPDATLESAPLDALDGDRVLELPALAPRAFGAAAAPQPAQAGFAAARPLAADLSAGLSAAGLSAAGLSAAGPSAAGLSAAGPSAARRRPRRETHGMLSLGEAAGEYTTALRAAFPTPMRPHAAGGPGMRGLGAETCPVCHGAGFVRDDVPLGDPSFGQAVPCVCKERALEERRRADLRRMSSLDAFHDKTFATFDASIPGLREAYEVARRYAEDPQGWLVLSGGYGAGKTHLAAAIASERLAAGQSVFFSITPDLLDHLRATFAPTSETPYDELFDKVREAGLLALDDLGAENGTAWATEKLFQIINYRYNYHMPTVITTNHRLLSHMDERIRSRLADISFVRHIAIDVPDYRERHTGARRRGSGASGGQAPRGPAATSHGRGGYTPR